jgi:hypothetical protein
MLMEKAGSLPAAGQKKFHYGFVILLLGILTTTGAVGFARYGYTTILPSMMEGLGLDNTGMGLMASGNLAGYMIFSLVAGFLASKYSPPDCNPVFHAYVGGNHAADRSHYAGNDGFQGLFHIEDLFHQKGVLVLPGGRTAGVPDGLKISHPVPLLAELQGQTQGDTGFAAAGRPHDKEIFHLYTPHDTVIFTSRAAAPA